MKEIYVVQTILNYYYLDKIPIVNIITNIKSNNYISDNSTGMVIFKNYNKISSENTLFCAKNYYYNKKPSKTCLKFLRDVGIVNKPMDCAQCHLICIDKFKNKKIQKINK